MNGIPKHKSLFKFLTLCFTLVHKFRFNRYDPDPDSIVVVSIHKLGDTIFTIPALKLLIEKNPSKKITVICTEEGEKLYRLAGVFNTIPVRIKEFLLGGRLAPGKHRKLIRNNAPASIIDLTGSVRSATLIIGASAGSIIGCNDIYFNGLYTEFGARVPEDHLIKRYIRIIDPRIKDGEWEPLALVRRKDEPITRIMIHPFAGWSAKEWGLNNFVSLCRKLSENYDCTMIFPEESLKDDVLRGLEDIGVKHIITSNIEDLIETVESCSFFIGCDSGPLYIAALLGKPTFTVYGPTNPHHSVPLGKHHGYANIIINCSPEHGRQYCFTDAGRNGCPSFECMNRLPALSVAEKIEEFVSQLNNS